MDDEYTLGPLPKHAVRYLAQLLYDHRQALVVITEKLNYSLQCQTAYDSLEDLESVIPDELWDEIKR